MKDFILIHNQNISGINMASPTLYSDEFTNTVLAGATLAEIGEELEELADTMQLELTERNRLKQEIMDLEKIMEQDPQAKDQIKKKQQALMTLNTMSEDRALVLQSLLQQRLEAVSLLSNIVSVHYQTARHIADNFKS